MTYGPPGTGPSPSSWGPSTPASPASAPAQVQAETRYAPAGVLSQPAPRRRTGLTVLAIVGISFAGVAVLAALAYTLLALQVAAFVGAILALIPLSIVLLGIWWIDRFEPEPWPARLFAIFWGAGVAVVAALIIGFEVDSVLSSAGSDPSSAGAQFFGAVIQAPIVEESAKGLGVLLIFLVARKLFDGPVDGIVYAATIAGGFAFTENILYFGRAVAEGGGAGNVLFTFLLRGIMSPFAHVMFTSMTGLGIGIAARYGSRWLGVVGYLVGVIPAMLLHALWNGSSFFVSGIVGFFVFYLLVQVPLFAGMVVLVVMLRRSESKLAVARLGEYAAAGWFNAAEVASLATPAGRSRARAWARTVGRVSLMNRYIRDATRLATTRQRIVSGVARSQAQQDERELLEAVTASRRALLGNAGTSPLVSAPAAPAPQPGAPASPYGYGAPQHAPAPQQFQQSPYVQPRPVSPQQQPQQPIAPPPTQQPPTQQ